MPTELSSLSSRFVVALCAIALTIAWRLYRTKPDTSKPRGSDIVVVLCGENAKVRAVLLGLPAVTLYECTTFGDQARVTASISARRDTSFAAVIVFEPFSNYEGLDQMMSAPMIQNFSRSMFRSAAGLVPVFGIVEELPLLRLMPPAMLGLLPPLFKPNVDAPVPSDVEAVVAAITT